MELSCGIACIKLVKPMPDSRKIIVCAVWGDGAVVIEAYAILGRAEVDNVPSSAKTALGSLQQNTDSFTDARGGLCKTARASSLR